MGEASASTATTPDPLAYPIVLEAHCGSTLPCPSKNPRPPPWHYQEIVDDLRDTIGIRDADPDYDELNECLDDGCDSSCAELSEDDDGDDGEDEYNRGGCLEQILWSPEIQQLCLPVRRRQRNRRSE
jgi:hypothetical protein